MATRRTPRPCACGCTYAAFRTGLTFGDVRKMMWTGEDDRGKWRNKRRRGVLGFWRELKIHMWEMNHGGCEDRIAA